MNSELNIQKFDAFLLGEMNEKKVTAFLRELENNPDLKTEFETYKQLTVGVEEAFLKEELTHIHQSINQKNKKRYTWMAVAASIALAIGAYWFFQPPKNEQLYAKYFIPDPGLPTVMGDVGNKYEFNDAMVDYKTGSYNTAITKWSALLEKHPENDTLNYYLGMAYLNVGDENKSLSFLEKKSVTGSSIFKNDAKWYKALLLIKQKEIDSAKRILTQLPETPQKQSLLDHLEK